MFDGIHHSRCGALFSQDDKCGFRNASVKLVTLQSNGTEH